MGCIPGAIQSSPVFPARRVRLHRGNSVDRLSVIIDRALLDVVGLSLLGETLRSGNVGRSLFGGHRAEEHVHLFETETLGLGQEEGGDGGENVDTGEEEEDAAVLEGQDDVGRESRDDEVPEPLGGRRSGETVRSGSVVEDLL